MRHYSQIFLDFTNLLQIVNSARLFGPFTNCCLQDSFKKTFFSSSVSQSVDFKHQFATIFHNFDVWVIYCVHTMGHCKFEAIIEMMELL